MRILHITPTYSPSVGGIESVVDNLSREAIRSGIVADVAHVRNGLRAVVEDEGDRVIYRIPSYGTSLCGFAPGLKSVACRYDLLHVHDPQLLCLTAQLGLQLASRRMVLSTHGGFNHTSNHLWIKQLHKRYLMRGALAVYDRILASSRNDHDFFNRYSKKVVLVENGVDVDRFSAVSEIDRGTDGHLKWIYWGRITKHKRIDCLIDTVRIANDLGFPVSVKVIGSGEPNLIEELKSRAAASAVGTFEWYPQLPHETLLDHIGQAGIFYIGFRV